MTNCDKCSTPLDENDLKHSDTTCWKCQFKEIGYKYNVTTMRFTEDG